MAPEDRAELLAVLTMDSDPTVADRAKSCLLTQSLESLQVALARPDADLKLFEYCADNMGGRPEVADRMAANAACPAEFVTRVSADLTSVLKRWSISLCPGVVAARATAAAAWSRDAIR